jgi:hypothetical protein
MASSGKRKTTMAKLARESRLRERRLNKQAKREARRRGLSEYPDSPEGVLNDTTEETDHPRPAQAALEPDAPPPAEVG